MTKRNNLSNDSIKAIDGEDALRVKYLTRQMFNRIEDYMLCLDIAKGQEVHEVEHSCAIMFGSKNSLAESLVFLTDHLFRLGKTEDFLKDAKAENNSLVEWNDDRLSDMDINLVKAFVERMNVKPQVE